MKNWVKYKISIKNLVIIFIIVMAGLVLAEISKVKIPTSYYQTQLEAARTMMDSLLVIREEREKRGIPIDTKIDPNKTGIIGEEYTPLTTTLGNLEAKRTSANPDFAALMVKYFQQAGLEEGDIVAIGASGSFPGLIIATLSACKAMNITPLIIYSIGASEYGATIPAFTFIDMLKILNEKEILPYKLLAVSMGGNNDQAEAMFYPDAKELIMDIAQSADTIFINVTNLAENIQKRMELYQEAAANKAISLFVNIGGASPNYGNTPASITYPNGLVINGPEIPDHPERGLIFEFQALEIPVIHLLNIRDLALKNGIPIDPVPLPEIGRSEVFFEYRYQKWIIIFTIFIALAYLIFLKRIK
ncbi:MAG: poly-gamma-glutamate system protein [Candidatus Caldatribacteriota bacterium]